MSEVSAQTGNLKYNRNSTIFDLTKMNSHGEIKFITKIVPDVNEQKTHIFTSTASG